MIVPTELSPLLEAIKAAGTHTFTCAPAPMQKALAEVCEHRNKYYLPISKHQSSYLEVSFYVRYAISNVFIFTHLQGLRSVALESYMALSRYSLSNAGRYCVWYVRYNSILELNYDTYEDNV